MELHHSKHHNTYVTSYNNFADQIAAAEANNDIQARIALQPMINFHGGGHINHSLFWENLAPKNAGGGEPPSGALAKSIDEHFGSLEEFKKKFNAALAGIQGSGWAWLVKDAQTGAIGIKTYLNQDPVVGQFKPLLGVDAWEHAVSTHDVLSVEALLTTVTQYYLQYQNRKAEYFSAIWDVINWKAAEKRFT
jgi:superoxide dismutase, Fe-Mn family